MKKHSYRSKKVNEFNWIDCHQQLQGQAVTLAIDVAKDQQYALLTNQGDIAHIIKWSLLETPSLIDALKHLGSPVSVVMEATGTYGDAMRYQFRQAGFAIYQAGAKRVYDAKKIYDGVPSLHDAKAACVIAKLHQEGLTRRWEALDNLSRELNAAHREYEIHQDQYDRNRNRLEAVLSRHWPEVLSLLELSSVTLEKILMTYGSPQRLAADADTAAEQIKAWGKYFLKEEKILPIIDSAKTMLGEPCIEAERGYIQALAREMQHSRCEGKTAKQRLEALIAADTGLQEMAATIGKKTTAIFVGLHLDPRNYATTHRYVKALGLNLKEKSSGQIKGRLSISKRGSATARQHLFLAALRLIQRDPIIGQWHQNKVDPNARMKTVVTCMRKLAKALWYVARGARFEASKMVQV